MLNEELFSLFLVTGTANILAPGLGSVLAVTLSLQYGWKKSMAGCAGLAAGIMLLFVIAVSGLGVVIAASPKLFAPATFSTLASRAFSRTPAGPRGF